MAELEIKPTGGMKARIFAIICISAAISMTLVYLLAGGGEEFFAPRSTLIAFMPDASGLSTDSEVRLSGIRVGKVGGVALSGTLDPQRVVRVELRILSRYLRNIPNDSKTDISSDTLVGYKFLDIAEGKSPVPIQDDGVLQSEPIKDAADRADLMLTLQRDLKEVDQDLVAMSSPETRMGQFIAGEQEYQAVLKRIGGFDQALHTFLTPQSTAGQAFYSAEFYNGARDLGMRVDKMLVAIQNGEGQAGKLFASDEQYNDFLRRARDLRTMLEQVSTGRGGNARLAAFLQDDAGYRRAARLLAATNAMLASLNAGEGPAGRLLASPQLYESLNGSLHQLTEVLRDLRLEPKKYLRVKPF
jgi:phospholipid/cholesterol/gamma-HCH transport system substrate-binding protein